MHASQDEDCRPIDDPRRQQQGGPEQVGGDHCRVHDRPQQPPLHHLEPLAIGSADRRLAMVDEQAGQVEQPCHPRDHRHDVQGLGPGIEVGQEVHRCSGPAAHQRHEFGDVIGWCLRRDAMAEIEDMPAPSAQIIRHLAHRLVHSLAAGD